MHDGSDPIVEVTSASHRKESDSAPAHIKTASPSIHYGDDEKQELQEQISAPRLQRRLKARHLQMIAIGMFMLHSLSFPRPVVPIVPSLPTCSFREILYPLLLPPRRESTLCPQLLSLPITAMSIVPTLTLSFPTMPYPSLLPHSPLLFNPCSSSCSLTMANTKQEERSEQVSSLVAVEPSRSQGQQAHSSRTSSSERSSTVS